MVFFVRVKKFFTIDKNLCTKIEFLKSTFKKKFPRGNATCATVEPLTIFFLINATKRHS